MNNIYYQQMRDIVKQGYEKGSYEEFFRKNRKITKMENEFFNIIIINKKNNNLILDLGCGTGIPYDKYMADLGFKITGIDIAKNHIQKAMHNVPNGEFILEDFSKIDFKNNHYYAILSLYSIFHIPRIEHEKIFVQIYNSLVTNGYFLVNFSINDREYKEKDTFCKTGKMAWSYYDLNTNLKMLQKIGFKIELIKNEKDYGSSEDIAWVLLKKTK